MHCSCLCPRLAHPLKQVCRSVVSVMAAAASASPLAAAAWASDKLIGPFAARAKPGVKAISRIHSTKRRMGSPFIAVRCETIARFVAEGGLLIISLSYFFERSGVPPCLISPSKSLNPPSVREVAADSSTIGAGRSMTGRPRSTNRWQQTARKTSCLCN